MFGEYEGDDDDGEDEEDQDNEDNRNTNNLDASNNRKVFDIMLTNLGQNNDANKYGYTNRDKERRKNHQDQSRYDNNDGMNHEDRRQSKRLKNRKNRKGFFGNSNSSKCCIPFLFST